MSDDKPTLTTGQTIVNDAAGNILAGIDENAAAAERNGKPQPANDQPAQPSNPQPATGPAWRREPLRNFQLDDRGQVNLRPDGTPRRKPGNQAKPRPGDKLADGTTYKPDQGATAKPQPQPANPATAKPSTAFDPFANQGGQPGQPDAAADNLGKVIIDGLNNAAAALVGDDAKMTDTERDSAGDYAGRAMGGQRIDPLTALGVILGAWGLRGWLIRKHRANQPGQPGQPTHDDNARLYNRADAKREKPPGESPNGGNLKDWERRYRP